MTDKKIVKLREIDGVIYASSRQMAEDFGGRRGGHDTMLELINKVRNDPEMSGIHRTSWFRDDFYFDSYNRRQPCIDMTRDGFTLVMMNYRGNIAWKVAYILKFDEMEGKLGTGARTDVLFDRTKRDNVVAFQGPPQAQGDFFAPPAASEPTPPPTQAELNTEANRRHLNALIGVPRPATQRRELPRYSPDKDDDGDEDDLVAPISRSSPELTLFWPDPLKGERAHIYRAGKGRSFKARRYLHEDGTLAEYWLLRLGGSACDIRSTLLPDPTTKKQFLLRWDVNVTALVARQTLDIDCGLKSTIADAIMGHFMADASEEVACGYCEKTTGHIQLIAELDAFLHPECEKMYRRLIM